MTHSTAHFIWRRGGRILAPGAGKNGFTHASHACALRIKGDEHLLVYSMRDRSSRSHLFHQMCVVRAGLIETIGEPDVALSPGELGTFDSDGLLACCILKIDDSHAWLYYTGWNNFVNGVWLCDSGIAEIDLSSFSFRRMFTGPIMARSRFNPYFAAATSVIREDTKFRSWYNSGIGWFDNKGRSEARYGIHYAESVNGFDWTFFPGQRISFSDEFEHSFGRPVVVRDRGLYRMWFSCRGGSGDAEYRLGYAFSQDGLTWQRDDSLSCLPKSANQEDFDSQAQAYPYVFDHEGYRYMLYSGNGYGLTGSGYAFLDNRCDH
jgi:hypothetical protein